MNSDYIDAPNPRKSLKLCKITCVSILGCMVLTLSPIADDGVLRAGPGEMKGAVEKG